MLTSISLLFRTLTCPTTAEDDILVREELESLQKEYPDRFSLHYTLDKAPAGWKFSEGFINKDMIEKIKFEKGIIFQT